MYYSKYEYIFKFRIKIYLLFKKKKLLVFEYVFEKLRISIYNITIKCKITQDTDYYLLVITKLF